MEQASAYRSALETRKRLQNAAREIGITEEYISILVDRFYDKVRADPALGPVFEGVVAGRWDRHLSKMKAFWASVALRTGTYEGKPVEAHRAIPDAAPSHFEIWMQLFELTLAETAPNEEVLQTFMRLARSIAVRLQGAMFR